MKLLYSSGARKTRPNEKDAPHASECRRKSKPLIFGKVSILGWRQFRWDVQRQRAKNLILPLTILLAYAIVGVRAVNTAEIFRGAVPGIPDGFDFHAGAVTISISMKFDTAEIDSPIPCSLLRR